MLAGLISNLHSFEAVRCIGWSVSVVYKVRDYEFGDPGVMEKMLASRMGMGGMGIYTYLRFWTRQKLSLRLVGAM